MRNSAHTVFGVPLAVLGGMLLAGGCISKNNFPKRYAEVFCDTLKKCDPDAYDLAEQQDGGCKGTAEAGAEDLIDACDDYKGGLAYQCLQDLKKASCDDEQPDSCKDFDDACGFGDAQAVVEYEGGVSVYGLGRIEFTPADP